MSFDHIFSFKIIILTTNLAFQGATFYAFYNSNTGEEQEKATKETLEVLKIIEEEALGDEKFFGGEDIGLLDLVLGWFAHWFDIIEELVGVKVLDASKLPRLHAWTENFKEVPVIKENLPDRSKLLAYFKHKYFAHLPSLDNQHQLYIFCVCFNSLFGYCTDHGTYCYGVSGYELMAGIFYD